MEDDGHAIQQVQIGLAAHGQGTDVVMSRKGYKHGELGDIEDNTPTR
jgi:hypothetical protein